MDGTTIGEMEAFMKWMVTARLTGSVGDHELVKDQSLKGCPGFVFCDGGYVLLVEGARGDRHLHVPVGRDELATDRLAEAVDYLWKNHSRENSDA